MTKPVKSSTVCGSGQLFNHFIGSVIHLPDALDNEFVNSADVCGISQVSHYWLAGLVKHARGLTALCCPTVNCYRRLHGPSAPCKAFVSTDDNDQTSSFRLKMAGATSAFVENRLPGRSANPYIVLAATVAAGLDGITNKYPPPEPGADVLLPQSLFEALDALGEDEVLVKALGVEFIQSFIRKKYKFEVDVLRGSLTDISIAKEQNIYWTMF